MIARAQLDLERDALADDAEVSGPTDNQLKSVAKLGEDLANIDVALSELAARVEQLTKRRQLISEDQLPTLMDSIGLRSYELKDGSKLTVDDVVHCGLTKTTRPGAIRWLRETKHDGIVKTSVSVGFGRGGDKEASQLRALLSYLDYDVLENADVNPQTLKKFVKEMLAEVEDSKREAASDPTVEIVEFPEELFGVYRRRVAMLTYPKRK